MIKTNEKIFFLRSRRPKTTINDNLHQLKKTLFQSWFINFTPWNGVRPADWELLSFSSILTPRNEKNSNPQIPLFSVTDTGIYPRNKKFNKKLSKNGTQNKIAYKGDLIFGMSREILNWGMMYAPIGAVSSAYNVFRVDTCIKSEFLEYFIKFNQASFKDIIKPASREGQGIDCNVLFNKCIYLPTSTILKKYYNIENSISSRINMLQDEILNLTQLRDSLLPKLMSGELDVSEVEI